MTDLKQVAQQAGVSRATAARAFATPEQVRESTRQRVLDAARSLNFRPNLLGRQLRQQSTRLIGVVGCVQGKDVAAMLTELEPLCAELVVTQNSSPRAIPADELGAIAVDVFGADRVSVHPQLFDALESAIELAEAGTDHALGGSGVLVTGSVVTAGEARRMMGGKKK